MSDPLDHGTHVAGTIAGDTVGVARQAMVHPASVDAGGYPSASYTIGAVNWAEVEASAGKLPAVANLSLSFYWNPSNQDLVDVEDAIDSLIDAGVTVVAAAGNDSTSAGSYTPARMAEVITVGATTSSDDFATYSNRGSAVDILAPGSSINSARSVGDSSYGDKSGTSMAAPHVAGVAALYLQDNPSATPAQVLAHLDNEATTGAISGVPSGTPNRLVFTEALNPSESIQKPEDAWITVVSPNTALLTWEDASINEHNFEIQRSSDLVSWSQVKETFANVESWSETLPGGSTFYRIRATNSDGSSAFASFTSPPQLDPPDAPSNVNVSGLFIPSWQGVTVTWNDNSDNETHFRIERRHSSSSTWQSVQTAAENTTSANIYDTSINCAPYYYRVVAVNDDGEGASSQAYFYYCE